MPEQPGQPVPEKFELPAIFKLGKSKEGKSETPEDQFAKLRDWVKNEEISYVADNLTAEKPRGLAFKDLTADQKKLVISDILDRIKTEKKDQVGRSQLASILQTLDETTYREMEKSGKVLDVTKDILKELDAEWQKKKPSDKRELFAANHSRVKQIYKVLSFQVSANGQKLCEQKLREISEEIQKDVHDNKDKFLAYLDENFPEEKREKSKSGDLVKTLRNYDKLAAAEQILRDHDLQGLKADLQTGIEASVKIQEMTGEGSAVTIRLEKGYCICTVKEKDGKESKWQIEPNIQERVIVRCLEGDSKNAFVSVERKELLDTLAKGKMDILFKQASDRLSRKEEILQTLEAQLKKEDDHYAYEAKDGSKWRLDVRGITIVLQSKENEKMRLFFQVSDLYGSDVESLVKQAQTHFEKESMGRKHLEAYDLPVESLKKENHKVAHINLFPKADGKNNGDPVPSSLAHAMYMSAAMKERYGDVVDVRPAVFSDTPKAALKAEVERAYADGCRVFCIDIFSHGSDKELMFPEKLVAADLVQIATDFCKEHPECKFNYGTIACFAGGLRYGFLREFQKNPDAAKNINVFLQVKPVVMNSAAQQKVPKGFQETEGLKDRAENAGTRYMNSFMKALLEKKATYGGAASIADLNVNEQTGNGLDAEVILDGELITMKPQKAALSETRAA